MTAGVPGSRSRSARAGARASRTVSGSGDQPEARPRVTIGGVIGLRAMIAPRLAMFDGRAATRQPEHRVGVLHDPFEAVLGHQHGEPEVVHEALHRRQDVLGCRGVERRGRLVQHQYARVRSEHRADRHPLRLATGQRGHRPVAQLDEPEQIEGVLDAATHHVGRQGQRFHRVGQLVLDGVGDERGRWVLRDDADDIGQLARRMVAGVAAGDAHAARAAAHR